MTATATHRDCPSCAAYLQRRRAALLPHIGRWVTRGHVDRRPAQILGLLLEHHHRAECRKQPTQT